MRRVLQLLIVFAAGGAFSCAEPVPDGAGADGDDLPLGELGAADGKADGNWGFATECKPIPHQPPLVDPQIIISLDGLTLHLIDRAGDYDRVFPVGVGAIDTDESSATYQESLSYYPLWRDGTGEFAIDTTNNWSFNPCRVWWTDSASGQRLPVFAGLPFMRWRGAYGIHGPITNYRAANGGRLERGYVSHGCIRMEAADVVEVYARISGTASVPVRVQREPERSPDRVRVDVDDRWIGADCRLDADCSYTGGFCQRNPYTGAGFCSAPCHRYCPDRFGQPTTFCVDDPDDASRGICVAQAVPNIADCRPYDHMVPATRARHGAPSRTAEVCLPGSRGWIGDRCFADDDCGLGTHCDGAAGDRPGMCTQSCTRFCPDVPARPTTFCAAPDAGADATCLRTCDPATAGAECAAGMSCVERARNRQPDRVEHVCVPD